MTPRQIYLQRLLGVPVLRNAAGEKLSKQTGARALTPQGEADAALRAASRSLGLPLDAVAQGRSGSLAAFWPAAIGDRRLGEPARRARRDLMSAAGNGGATALLGSARCCRARQALTGAGGAPGSFNNATYNRVICTIT